MRPYPAELYAAYATEGWDTLEKLAAEADPRELAATATWARLTGLPWPPPARERDLAGQIIAAAFGLEVEAQLAEQAAANQIIAARARLRSGGRGEGRATSGSGPSIRRTR